MLSHSSSLNVFGSFFPIWLLCAAAAIGLTLGARYLLILAGLDDRLGPGAVVYPSLAVLFACAIWLVFFGQ